MALTDAIISGFFKLILGVRQLLSLITALDLK